MAARNPLVLISGVINELPAADTLNIVTSGASFVPTLLSSTFTIPDNSQALMGRRIVIAAGGSIVIGTNSALMDVA